MNTNTQTVDERCAWLAGRALNLAVVYGPCTHADLVVASLANRIIALRTAEAAQAEGGAL